MKHKESYMRIAHEIAARSYANKLKVGCVIVKYNMIISDGYNGTISGFPNICEDPETGKTYMHVLHAEANAILKLAKVQGGSLGASLFVTVAPCLNCAKLIIQAGIKEVIYAQEWRNGDGIPLLLQAGITVEHLKTTEDEKL